MEPEKKSSGALIGLIVIIIILVAGGIYMWQTSKNKVPENSQSQVTDQDAAALNALEQEINTADTSLGVDVSAIE